jgi:hypothetical protein
MWLSIFTIQFNWDTLRWKGEARSSSGGALHPSPLTLGWAPEQTFQDAL